MRNSNITDALVSAVAILVCNNDGNSWAALREPTKVGMRASARAYLTAYFCLVDQLPKQNTEREAVAKVRHFDYRGIARNGFSQEAEMLDGAPVLPDGTLLYAGHAERARVPEPTEAMVEAICREHARGSVWPDDFDRRAQQLRRESAVRGYKAALAATPFKPEQIAARHVVHWPRQVGRTSVQLAALLAALQLYPSRNTHQLQATKVCAGVARLAETLLAERAAEVSHG